jgi:Zn-dependent peptidase ImmA (M78 family)
MINIKDTLFVRDKSRFDNVEKQANEQLVNLNSGQRVKDDIFRILKNIDNLHLIKFPIKDNDLTAFKIEKEKIFIYINSSLPLEKQIFGGAHELYHVLHKDDNSKEDLLTDYEESFNNVNLKEMEANSFAACFLVPKEQLIEEINKLKIEKDRSIMNIIRLMDIFAVPYKAMILRLFECGIIKENIATEFLAKIDRDPKKDVLLLINQTRNAVRWQKNTEDEEEFSNLIELALRNYKEGIITREQINEDFKRLGINVNIYNFLEEETDNS